MVDFCKHCHLYLCLSVCIFISFATHIVFMYIRKYCVVFTQVVEYTEIGEIMDVLCSEKDTELSQFTIERYSGGHYIDIVL